MNIEQLIKDLKLKLQSLSKQELAAVIVGLADHSFGLQEVYRRQYGSNAKAEFDSRIGTSLTRSKKGMQEEINNILMSFPAAALWLSRKFFGLNDEELHRIGHQAVPLILGGNLEPKFRANQLWFFLDVLYQQGEAENFEAAVSLGTGLYFYVLNQWDKYEEGAVLRFEELMFDLFDGIGYQLKDEVNEKESLYKQVVGQLEKNRHALKLGDAKKIKALARVIRVAA